MTVMLNVQLVMLVPNCALTFTTLSPAGNSEPETGKVVTVAPSVVKGGGYWTTAEFWPGAAITARFVGQTKKKQSVEGADGSNSKAPRSTIPTPLVLPERI